MLKKELDKKKWLSGSILIDHENQKVFFLDEKSNNEILLTDSSKVMSKGISEADYKNRNLIGYFSNGKEIIEPDELKDTKIYLQKSIHPDLKEFLQQHLDSKTLRFLADELYKYEVTLYDCVFFNSYENHTEKKYITGTNTIQFSSDETFGYCYLIHKFRIDECRGISIVNEFEFISLEGNIKKYSRIIETEEDVVSEEQELERQFLEFYDSKYNDQNE